MLIEPITPIDSQPKGMTIMTHTTTTLAVEFDTTPRELRKFLRSADMGVGKGSRYTLPASKREVSALNKRFTAWAEAKAPKIEEDAPEAPEGEVDIDA
jgi:hypothetical protein